MRCSAIWRYPILSNWQLFSSQHRIATSLGNSYAKIHAVRFDPDRIGQLKVDLDGKSVVMSSIAQVAANTQISYLVTPFDPAVEPILWL